MKALVKEKAAPGLSLLNVDKPEISSHEVLIKIRKTAICGTDLHIYKWDQWAQETIPTPLTIGHEFMGEISAVGDLVKNLQVGDRVSGEGHLTCGHCRNCRAGRLHLCRQTKGIGIQVPGAFAEYLAIPASNVVPLPDTVSDDFGAILDPYGNALHSTLSFPIQGEDVLITGAGPIGLMAVAIAKHVGARKIAISDVNPYRLAIATKLGADLAFNAEKTTYSEVMQKLEIKEGFDVGLEMSGHPGAFRQMLRALNHGAKLAVLGIFSQEVAIDWSQIIFKGITLKGIYGRECYETWYKMISLLQSGLDLRPVITHSFPAEKYQEAFELGASGQAAKVILDWAK